jgi:putative tricarboxylic transport membrane protein
MDFSITANALVALGQGLLVACEPANLLYALLGCLLGTAVGVLPGVGPAVTLALLLPVTAKLEPTGAMIMFAGVYYGAMYGGSTTAILLNTPGESGSIVTSLEGNRMARAGRAGPALATAAIGSFVAGLLATAVVALLAPWVVEVALKFGPAEYFALLTLAFITVTVTLGKDRLKGAAALIAGIGAGMVGIDGQTGQPRLAMNIPELFDGIEVTLIAMGLFAIGETLYAAVHEDGDDAILQTGRVRMSPQDWRKSWPAWLRGTAIGFPFGCIPAGGVEIPTFLSYAVEKRLSAHPEEFGHGAIEGVAGPEAANNAGVTAALVPMLALGLPVSATAAMMLAGFQQYGLQPGPLLFTTQPELVWGLIASLLVGNVVLLALNLPLVGLWVRLLAIPKRWLYAGIIVFAMLGTYGMRQSAFDLWLLLGAGLIGYGMRWAQWPLAPAVIGLILGPLSEGQLRRALSITQGDWSGLVASPISIGLLTIALSVAAWPIFSPLFQRPPHRAS